MSFWISELGEISGSAEDAFAKSFKQIPDGTKASAQIKEFSNTIHNGNSYLNIDWVLIDGDFKGQKVNQKIRVMDEDPKKRHRALNMLKLIYNLFNISPNHSRAPSDQDLNIFIGKTAGIVIRETEPNDEGKQYNWVSEVHSSQNFKPETGIKLAVAHSRSNTESAFSRNAMSLDESLTDDVPF